MTIVYIASPYSGYANPQDGVNIQIDTFAILRDLGYQPIAPLLSHYIDERHPASYERWMEWCLAMVGVADVVLRLPGESAGADREAAEARRLGKPVVYSIDELQNISPDVYLTISRQTEDAIFSLLHEIIRPRSEYNENQLTMAHDAIRGMQARAKEASILLMGGEVNE